MELETSRHHSLFPRRHYKTRVERRFRQHPALINRLEQPAHDELHAVLQPPLKLTHQQMLGALCFLDEVNAEPLQAFERVQALGEYLQGRSLRESKVGANLLLQADYIEVYGAVIQ